MPPASGPLARVGVRRPAPTCAEPDARDSRRSPRQTERARGFGGMCRFKFSCSSRRVRAPLTRAVESKPSSTLGRVW